LLVPLASFLAASVSILERVGKYFECLTLRSPQALLGCGLICKALRRRDLSRWSRDDSEVLDLWSDPSERQASERLFRDQPARRGLRQCIYKADALCTAEGPAGRPDRLDVWSEGLRPPVTRVRPGQYRDRFPLFEPLILSQITKGNRKQTDLSTTAEC
jgi:hypothetical protein